MSKTIGIVRRMDDLGRVCLPKELRKAMCLEPGDPVEIIPTSDGLMLTPYKPDEPDFKTVEKVLDAMCGGNKVKRKNVFNGLARWQWEQNLVSDAVDDDVEEGAASREGRTAPPMPTARGH